MAEFRPLIEEGTIDTTKIDESYKRDFDGSRFIYSRQVSTSQALRQRALAGTSLFVPFTEVSIIELNGNNRG